MLVSSLPFDVIRQRQAQSILPSLKNVLQEEGGDRRGIFMRKGRKKRREEKRGKSLLPALIPSQPSRWLLGLSSLPLITFRGREEKEANPMIQQAFVSNPTRMESEGGEVLVGEGPFPAILNPGGAPQL